MDERIELRGVDISEYLPEDVVEEVMRESTKERRKRREKKPYPSSRELAEIIAVAARAYQGSPNEFPGYVIELLEERGYYTGHVTIKRIWRMYEKLVERKVIIDYLGVVARREEE